MKRDVRIGRMDTNRFAQKLCPRSPLADEVEEPLGRPALVAGQDSLFQLRVPIVGLPVHLRWGQGHRHSSAPPNCATQDTPLLRTVERPASRAIWMALTASNTATSRYSSKLRMAAAAGRTRSRTSSSVSGSLGPVEVAG